ncbi:DUF302 domain-containing protein [Ammoniphilus sp. YIM 78166]|uniref:DUF302 domain-containing protein n=1 Tax=Ammoniphilus sp. YIM 78166 TaxID=1644106 RepID=UPI00106F673A|nr:DUF302 domain-containing protein [Ammoniphilus sp. YIM 78166]
MDFHYTVITNKSIDDAINSLEQNLKEHKFGILWQLDLPAKLEEKGVDTYTNPYRILEVVIHTKQQELKRNELVGYFLPCKIVVYESDGKRKIGLPKPTSMINLLDDEELKEIAEGIEQNLVGVLEKSK